MIENKKILHYQTVPLNQETTDEKGENKTYE